MAAKTAGSLSVGRRLRELRERLGMPKEQVALALKMSAGNWAHYESGRNQLAATMLPALADLYGMTVAELAAEILDRPTTAHDDASESRNGITGFVSIKSILMDTEHEMQAWIPSRPSSAPTRELVAAGR